MDPSATVRASRELIDLTWPEWIRASRMILGWSQTRMAYECARYASSTGAEARTWSQDQVSRWERGDALPSPSQTPVIDGTLREALDKRLPDTRPSRAARARA